MLHFPPLHLTTAIFGSVSSTARFITTAISSIVFVPPTGQNLFSKFSSLTIASAKALQPANPQPPQLAPGSFSQTVSIRGSSKTLNFWATKYKIKAATAPMILNAKIA